MCSIFVIYKKEREIMNYREEVNRLLDVDNQGWGTDDMDRLREIFNKLMNRDDSNSNNIDHLKYVNKRISNKLDNLKNDYVKLSKQLDNRGRDDSLSLDDLREITEVLKDCNYMVPSCFWKLVKMMEKLDVPKEMTVEEIERVLGHSIKVVGESR